MLIGNSPSAFCGASRLPLLLIPSWKILQISDNCRKGKFDELSEYLKDDLGVENSEQLKECKIQKHQKISEYLKGRLEDKYMDLVSASTPR